MMPMHVDLSEAAGLPISLDLETGKLDATGDVELGEQGERRLSQLREVLADPEAATDDRICYRTYRGVGTKADRELLEAHGLRYDITVTMPGLIGREFTKTAGHYHSRGPDGIVYPEIYEVIFGKAAFVFEVVRMFGGYADIPICEPRERITIPFDCGHVTVNIGTAPLVVCDLIASECTNNYDSYRTWRGALYYIVRSDDGFAVEPNPSHLVPVPLIHPPEIGASSTWDESSLRDIPLIESFRRDPTAFRFLTETTSFVFVD
jgi:glucose-6-phosphate isomerase